VTEPHERLDRWTKLDQFTARRLAREINGTAILTDGAWAIVKAGHAVRVFRGADGELTVAWNTREVPAYGVAARFAPERMET
jgi:hypothetical protein